MPPHGSAGKLALWLMLGLGLLGWIANPGPYISDDSYFYPVIARNIVLHGEHSFSRLIPTNGIHPLWLYLLTGYSAIVAALNPALLYCPGYAIPLVAATTLAGAFVWIRVGREHGLDPGPAVGIPLSFLLVLGVLYSEAHLFFLCLGATFLAVARCRTRPKGLLWVGSMAGLTVLARLDAIFVVGVLMAGVAIERPPSLRRGLTLALGASILLVPYLVANAVFFGGLMPVSGWMKSSFPEVFLKGIEPRGLSTTVFGYGVIGIVSLLVGAIALARRVSRGTARGGILLPLLVGSALHFGYVALFTRSHTGWYWYYVTNAVLLGASVATLLERTRGGPLLGWLLVPLVAATGLAQVRQAGAVPEEAATLRLIERAGVGEGTVLVSDWPGYPAFHSRARILAADLLTANRGFYARMRRSQNALEFLLEHARDSGHPIRAIVCNGNHWLVPSADRRHLTYNDPRRYPVPRAIGWMTVDPPAHADGSTIMWRVDESRPSR